MTLRKSKRIKWCLSIISVLLLLTALKLGLSKEVKKQSIVGTWNLDVDSSLVVNDTLLMSPIVFINNDGSIVLPLLYDDDRPIEELTKDATGKWNVLEDSIIISDTNHPFVGRYKLLNYTITIGHRTIYKLKLKNDSSILTFYREFSGVPSR